MNNKIIGIVKEAYAGARFLLELEDGREVKAYLSGKMKIKHIQVNIGDKVEVVLDPNGGNATNRIVYRL